MSAIFTAAEIDALFQEEGRAVTFRKYSTTPADSMHPRRGPSKSSLTEASGYAVQDQGPPGRKDRVVWGADRTGVMNVIARTDSDLETFSEMHDGTDVWRIEHCRRVSPGGFIYYYEVRVAR